ncbi:MAG: ATP synthase F1 subunit delta [Candidatus Omnitrophica bacterium]|nr:ATP synthase F1 subunit delta [Candidatus Omnitrophota bacterium]
MKNRIIVKRYAEAYIAYAKETSGLGKAIEDFKQIKDILRDNPEFLKFLQAPEITVHQKNDFIDLVLANSFSKEFAQFLKLLLEKSRIELLGAIAEYVRVTYSFGNEVEAVFKTSFPLDLPIIEKIKKRLEEKLKKKLKFYIELDGTLLGGVQVTIGNTVIDGSIRRRLDDLRDKLETVRV